MAGGWRVTNRKVPKILGQKQKYYKHTTGCLAFFVVVKFRVFRVDFAYFLPFFRVFHPNFGHFSGFRYLLMYQDHVVASQFSCFWWWIVDYSAQTDRPQLKDVSFECSTQTWTLRKGNSHSHSGGVICGSPKGTQLIEKCATIHINVPTGKNIVHLITKHN